MLSANDTWCLPDKSSSDGFGCIMILPIRRMAVGVSGAFHRFSFICYRRTLASPLDVSPSNTVSAVPSALEACEQHNPSPVSINTSTETSSSEGAAGEKAGRNASVET